MTDTDSKDKCWYGLSSADRTETYQTPVNKREKVEEAVKDMLDAGMIARSRSPRNIPIVIVEKNDGGHRFYEDFRQLKAVAKPLGMPLPFIDIIMDLLVRSTCFGTLDLRSRYWHLAQDEPDQKADFACHMRLFNLRVMSFGLSNALGIFTQSMFIVWIEGFARAYWDVLVFSWTPEEHFQHLQKVFDWLRRHGLKLMLLKCQFWRGKNKYIGFVINEGINLDIDKVEVIRVTPNPTISRGSIGAIGGSYLPSWVWWTNL